MNSEKHRNDIDLCRVFACIMVIAMHIPDICPPEGLSPVPELIRSSFIFFSRAGVPIFYMITGSLYLERGEISTRKAVRKALSLLALYLVWSSLYLIREQLLFCTYHSFNEFYCALFTGHYHLWFLSSIAMAYLFLPVLHGAIHGKAVDIKYIFVLLAVICIGKFNAEMLLPSRWLGPFTLLSDDVLPVFFYMLLGCLLSRYRPGKFMTALLGVLSLSSVVLSVLISKKYASVLPNFLGGTILPYSLMNLLTSVFVFSLSGRLTEGKSLRFIPRLAGLSLGVYLIHPFFIGEIGRLEASGFIPALFTASSKALRFPFILVLVTVLSFLAAFIIGKIPVLRKLIR